MARKTAMGKEPGSVSVALPQSEKDRLRGGGQRMPGKPRPMDDKGNFTDKQSLERVSPGVYRNSQGKLVGSKGQTLPKRSPIQNALQGAAQAAGQQTGMQANIQGNLQAAGMEGGRMPAGQPGQQFSQREIDAGMEAQRLAESFMAQYPSGKFPMENWQGGNSQLPQFFGGLGDYRPIQPNERGRYGIDPRDPNQYQVGPNGEIRGTLMGWSPNANMGNVNQIVNRQQQAPAQPNSVSGLLRQGR